MQEQEGMVISLKGTMPPAAAPVAPVPASVPAPAAAPAEAVRGSWKRLFARGILVALLGVICGGGLEWATHARPVTLQHAAAAAALQPATSTADTTDPAALVARIGAHFLLPEGDPTVARISDLAPLQDQPFFKHAAVGDILLIYMEAQKAILYDPRQDKVLEVGPVATSTASSTTQLSP